MRLIIADLKLHLKHRSKVVSTRIVLLQRRKDLGIVRPLQARELSGILILARIKEGDGEMEVMMEMDMADDSFDSARRMCTVDI